METLIKQLIMYQDRLRDLDDETLQFLGNYLYEYLATHKDSFFTSYPNGFNLFRFFPNKKTLYRLCVEYYLNG